MKGKRVVVVDEEVLGEMLRQGLAHRDITKRLMELIDRLGDGHCDCYGAVGIAIQMERLIRGGS